jgi:hypothetical protein
MGSCRATCRVVEKGERRDVVVGGRIADGGAGEVEVRLSFEVWFSSLQWHDPALRAGAREKVGLRCVRETDVAELVRARLSQLRCRNAPDDGPSADRKAYIVIRN